jgi:magnesium and cobalt transporter
MKSLARKLAEKSVRRIDPKLEKFRPQKDPTEYVPSDEKELIELIKRTPKNVLSAEQRAIISSAMSFKTRPVSDIMIPKSDMVFVHENDFLGPLTLDKLYKTGFMHFPILGSNDRIIGLLHASSLMHLEIKDTDRAKKYLDENVYYMRYDYTLEMALAAFLRTNCHFFIVINKTEDTVGLLTYEILAEALLGRKVYDSFDRDLDPSAVARR